ncbi:Polynucleotidyl transferase ribonuclease H-like superfamily protein [Euphorbia peplus]|nr:Polynucleotidyl transferase ribonuclease H-like superfamily protein [Euphorbia peplus]
MPMFISDVAHFKDQSIYTAHFFGTRISVTVTDSASVVNDWLTTTISLRRHFLRRLIVGLGVQWNPRYSGYIPAHTLQLCIGTRCLIFQLSLANQTPSELRSFLLDTDYTFVGLWNGGDNRRLMASGHDLEVHRLLDMRNYVENDRGESLARVSVEEIVEEVLGFEGVRLDYDISMSAWDDDYLSNEQVLQACIDAHVSFLIGKQLRAWNL